MKRMRRLSQAIDEIRLEDPNTALTPWHLRQMVLTGELPCYHAGRTILIDIDVLYKTLEGELITPKMEMAAPGNYSAIQMRRIGG